MWAIAAHGGANAIAAERCELCRQALSAAMTHGENILSTSGSALDAVEAVVAALEAGGIFNAGCGSVRNRNGEVELDAAIMDGETLSVGAVAAVKQCVAPIRIARALLMELPTLIVGEGALVYAAQHNLLISAEPPPSMQEDGRGHDTVGCIALDEAGHVAVATSTGGLQDMIAGRVGDAPLPGCGFYAEDDIGAVALSGDGESIARLALASRILFDLHSGTPADLCAQHAIKHILRVGGEAGCIILNPAGDFAFAHNSEQFCVGYASCDTAQKIWLHMEK